MHDVHGELLLGRYVRGVAHSRLQQPPHHCERLVWAGINVPVTEGPESSVKCQVEGMDGVDGMYDVVHEDSGQSHDMWGGGIAVQSCSSHYIKDGGRWRGSRAWLTNAHCSRT
jgi:hypothetical protein